MRIKLLNFQSVADDMRQSVVPDWVPQMTEDSLPSRELLDVLYLV